MGPQEPGNRILHLIYGLCMYSNDKALMRLYSMSDWQELNLTFNSKKLLKELEPFDADWKKYNPSNEKNNRWGLSVTSLDGGLSGIPDLMSLKQHYDNTGQQVSDSDINVPTRVWTECETVQRILEPFRPWVIRTHFLRLDAGSYFPDHHDMLRREFCRDHIRLTAFVNVNEYSFKWIYDDKIIKCNNGSIWYFNSHKRHCVFSTADNMLIMVILLEFNEDLYFYLMNNMRVS